MFVSGQPHWTHGVSLHGLDWVLAGLMLTWLLVAEPLLGRRGFRRFLAEVTNHSLHARQRFYRQWIVQGWAMALMLLALAHYALGWSAHQLGFRIPSLPARMHWPFLAGVATALLVGAGLGVILARLLSRRAPPKPSPSRPLPDVFQMLPRTRAERRTFALLSLTAGITEEAIWRGVLLAMLVAAFPHLPLLVLGAVMAIAFGWAHLYQGPGGVLGTTVIGALLTALYLVTGSLWLPMLVHVAIDLLAILRAPRPSAACT